MKQQTKLDRKFSIAPMMDWTDKYCRYFHRLISRHALLYTEMVTPQAILFGDAARHLAFDKTEHPLALQLGGSNPEQLAEAAKIAETYGYDEINLNVGCPSDRVQTGNFGACLMEDPNLVANCIKAMGDATSLPITVKTRIGIDDKDDPAFLKTFVQTVHEKGGATTFIIHARKAWLSGLSPKENRTIPPLIYDRAYWIKQQFPDLEIIVNGGITSHDQIAEHLNHIDGVMIGREAYENPMFLADADNLYFNDPTPPPTAHEALEKFIPFIEDQLAKDIYLNHMTRHILGIFQGQPGAKAFRRHLSENAHLKGANADVLREAMKHVSATS